MCFSAAASSENDHGSMNLASNTAPVPSTMPSSVAAIQRSTGCRTRCLDVFDRLPGVALVPMPVEGFGHEPELDDEVAGQVLRLGLAPFLPPEAEQGGLVVAHDDPGVGAADEATTALIWLCPESRTHRPLRFQFVRSKFPGLAGASPSRCRLHHTM